MSTKKEILNRAHEFLDERIQSLLSDVRYCVLRNENTEDWPAPLPALLYCFATIDLLGALYSGNVTSSGSISKRSLSYMKDVMSYPEREAELLQMVFRHKIVHLAQLQPKVKKDGRVFTWRYYHNNREKHLTISKINKGKELFEFCVSIWSLAEDIANSVKGQDGYYIRLKQRETLRKNVEKAYAQIFEAWN